MRLRGSNDYQHELAVRWFRALTGIHACISADHRGRTYEVLRTFECDGQFRVALDGCLFAECLRLG